MFSFFKKRKTYTHSAGGSESGSPPVGYYSRPTFDSGLYSHRLAPFADVNGGAEEFVFETPFQNPVFLFRGPGRLAGSFLPSGSGYPEISLHPIGAPQGIPQVTGDIEGQIESNEISSEGVIG